MEFNEFREKYNISQDSLHKLVLEAHELLLAIEEERKGLAEECLKRGLAPEEYEYEPGSARDEHLYGFLRLLTDDRILSY